MRRLKLPSLILLITVLFLHYSMLRALAQMVPFPGPYVFQPAAAAGISVIDGTTGFASGSSTSNSAHSLNVHAGDQLYIVAYWTSTAACASPTFTWTFGGGTETVTAEGSNIINQWLGGQCSAQFTLQSIANATATETIQLAITGGNVNTSGASGFEVGQMRGTANTVADQKNCNDASGPPGTSVVVPVNSGNTNCTNAASLTTTHADAIVWGGIVNPTNATPTPTTNGCFSVTGLVPTNTTPGTNTAAIQYTILSSTQSGICAFTQSSSTWVAHVAVYH